MSALTFRNKIALQAARSFLLGSMFTPVSTMASFICDRPNIRQGNKGAPVYQAQ